MMAGCNLREMSIILRQSCHHVHFPSLVEEGKNRLQGVEVKQNGFLIKGSIGGRGRKCILLLSCEGGLYIIIFNVAYVESKRERRKSERVYVNEW